jgi:hypothetical protein
MHLRNVLFHLLIAGMWLFCGKQLQLQKFKNKFLLYSVQYILLPPWPGALPCGKSGKTGPIRPTRLIILNLQLIGQMGGGACMHDGISQRRCLHAVKQLAGSRHATGQHPYMSINAVQTSSHVDMQKKCSYIKNSIASLSRQAR